MTKSLTIQTWLGFLIAALGCTVLVGWGLRNPQLLQIMPGFVAMVVNTALCFMLIGLALIFPVFSNNKQLPVGLGVLVSGISSAVLLQIILGVDLEIDFRHAHDWLQDGNPTPGRMAPNTAMGFILAGLVLVLSKKVTHRRIGVVVQVATFSVLLIGLTGLVGYSLQLEMLYSWFKAARMALPTAVGMILVGLGLWSSWRNADWYISQHHYRDEEKITFLGAALLVVVAVTTGVAAFAVQQATLEKALIQNLHSVLKSNAALYGFEVDQAVTKAISAASRSSLIHPLRQLKTKPENAQLREELKLIAQNILSSGPNAIAIYGPSTQPLMQLGQLISRPAIQKNLGLAHPSILFWDKRLYLKTSVPIFDKDEMIGSVTIQEPLILLTRIGLGGRPGNER